ncbi:hypothetical protein ONE63_011504 [Megalurothrips usitatus]|uniref:Uncharacterized protein n=1 Tax=Megalurothrips usitatus TaxID=439358 RepID=A0AAV7WZT4_9NEOP|nr:hypothetical protein ONE63_011504 [Megalurothrips usitatus]
MSDPEHPTCVPENALYLVWGQVRVVGCVVHFAVAVYRWMRTHGHLQALRDPNVAHVVRMVTAIPRARVEDIPLAFRAVRRIAEARQCYAAVYPVLAYVWREWVCRVGGRVLSVFGHYHTNNNSCEVHHNAMQTMANLIKEAKHKGHKPLTWAPGHQYRCPESKVSDIAVYKSEDAAWT